MIVYTRIQKTIEPNFEPNSLINTPSPDLVFKKWQAYDDFEGFDHKETRTEYLRNIANLSDKVRDFTYSKWYQQYKKALISLGAKSKSYTSLWRLTVGFSTNPTMETGATMHHLYGFPYIPGVSIKGAVHHYSEQELLEKNKALKALQKEPVADSAEIEEINNLLHEAEIIKEMYGSIFEESNEKVNSPSLKERLQAFNKRIKDKEEWQAIYIRINTLLSGKTGGLVQFYDSVPYPNEVELLQIDILNPHYPDYYDENNQTSPPSDDQNPKPVYFLAVKPQTQFSFYYMIKKMAHPGNNEDAKQRFAALKSLAKPDEKDIEKVRNQVLEALEKRLQNNLEKALSIAGLGAKTAAGYGYFQVASAEQTTDFSVNHNESKTSTYSDIVASPPSPVVNPKQPQAKLNKIDKRYNQQVWLKIANSPHIEQLSGILVTGKPAQKNISPLLELSKRKIVVFYKRGFLYCTVQVDLKGVQSMEEAKFIWENNIKPLMAQLESKEIP